MGIVRLLFIEWVCFVAASGLAGCGASQTRVHEPEDVAVHTCVIDGLTIQTGDLICTNTTRGRSLFAGLFYQLYGMAIPGPVDHVVVYVGPGGRCVEAGAKFRVGAFDLQGDTWDASKMTRARGSIFDTLYGVAYPLAGRSLGAEEEAAIRRAVAGYCLRQAAASKPYNVVFADSGTEKAFYCSQLAYKAYLEQGIDLNTNVGVPDIPGTGSIVYPQEIWNACEHKRAPDPSPEP